MNTNPEQTKTKDNLVFYDKIKIVEGPHNPCDISDNIESAPSFEEAKNKAISESFGTHILCISIILLI